MSTTLEAPTGLCLAPSCTSPKLDLGAWAFLCLEHALEAVAPPPVRALLDLRGRCWGEAMTCTSPAITLTAHGTYCRGHAPTQPKPPIVEVDEDDERASQLAVLTIMSSFEGSTISKDGPSLWATRAYGDSDEPANVTRSVTYPRSTPSRASTITLDDERVPRTARGMARSAKGWSVRLRAVDEPASVVLRAWRGPLLVVACWVEGSFESAWVQHSRGLPYRLQARQAGALLKAAP